MNAEKGYSVFLVDDDKMFLTSLKNNLQQKFGGLLKISEYATGEECIESIESHKDTEAPPDVVILDYYLNDSDHPDAINGIKAMREIKSISNDTTVIMLSSEDKLQVAVDSVKNGAYEYIVKSESAFVRIQHTMKKVIENIKALKKSSNYIKANITLAAIILAIILLDIIWYYSYHYNF